LSILSCFGSGYADEMVSSLFHNRRQMRQDGSSKPTIEKEGETMREITTVGMDLAKNVFHVVCHDQHDKEVKKRMLKRVRAQNR
jgi:hypothetical protein